MATIASLLRDHVTLAIRSIYRIFMHAYCPRLQTEGQAVRFLLDRGYPIPSPAALGKIGKQLVADIDAFIARHSIPVVRFQKKDSKEKTAATHLDRARAEGRYGVVLVGVAQEKADARKGMEVPRRHHRPSPLLLPPPVRVRQPLLLLHPRPRLRAVLLQAVPGDEAEI